MRLRDKGATKVVVSASEFAGTGLRLWMLLTMAAVLPCSFCSADDSAAKPSPQNPLKDLTLAQLGNVEVTAASKVPEQVWKISAAIFVVTQDDIRRSGETTIPGALRLVPGVEVARINSNRWSIGIRGFGSRLTSGVLVLTDGRTVYTTLLAGMYWEVQNLMLADVERIEVIRGPNVAIKRSVYGQVTWQQ